ncbi:hypothetical protein CsSME_00031706 [Camellia sinensis var. sinensis]
MFSLSSQEWFSSLMEKGHTISFTNFVLVLRLASKVVYRLNLKSAVEFHYLSQSGCLAIDDVDDARKFQMLMEALDTVRLCKEDQDNAFEMLAAVLWLGNISFQVIDNENHVEVVADEGGMVRDALWRVLLSLIFSI